MKARYVIGALIGAGIGITLSYLYGQSGDGTVVSQMWIGALIGALAGLYIVASASSSGRTSEGADGCGSENLQFG